MRKRRTMKPPGTRKGSFGKVQTSAKYGLMQRRPMALAVAATVLMSLAAFVTLRPSVRPSGKKLSQRKAAQNNNSDAVVKMAPVYAAEVIAEYEHDQHAFTQGLAWHDGRMYESTGLNGRSSVREVDVETGKVVASHSLKEEDFGEGVTIAGERGDELVQVLWQIGKGYVYDRETLVPKGEFRFSGDGWGVARSAGRGDEVFLSDGSSSIRVLRRQGAGFVEARAFVVRDGASEVGLLNELEVIGDEIWANVWMSDFVARIDAKTGRVRGWVDLREILKKSAIPAGHSVDVLNGIAYDAEKGRVFVTGKLWPRLFQVRVTEEVVAESVRDLGNAFFLNREQVAYVHQHVLP